MTEPRRLRRPPAGGYIRGDETRSKIIAAAIVLFGQLGFDGASTREIAARAGVNAPAVQYYFENKEGLYRACAESLADDAWAAFEPAVLHAQACLNRYASVDELIDSLLAIQRAVMDHTFVKHSEPDQRPFFAREQNGDEPECGSIIMCERVRNPLNAVNLALLARITNIREDDPVTVVRMFSLYGQFFLFFIARKSTLSILGWDDIDEEKAAHLKVNFGEQTRILLEFWHQEGKTSRRGNVSPSPVNPRIMA
jgi:TetR/AcrR family transcriptional regulator, regulator of cefoperazone and chloramphenicol sensitivity